MRFLTRIPSNQLLFLLQLRKSIQKEAARQTMFFIQLFMIFSRSSQCAPSTLRLNLHPARRPLVNWPTKSHKKSANINARVDQKKRHKHQLRRYLFSGYTTVFPPLKFQQKMVCFCGEWQRTQREVAAPKAAFKFTTLRNLSPSSHKVRCLFSMPFHRRKKGVDGFAFDCKDAGCRAMQE